MPYYRGHKIVLRTGVQHDGRWICDYGIVEVTTKVENPEQRNGARHSIQSVKRRKRLARPYAQPRLCGLFAWAHDKH